MVATAKPIGHGQAMTRSNLFASLVEELCHERLPCRHREGEPPDRGLTPDGHVGRDGASHEPLQVEVRTEAH